jgi:hypothetical protein
VRRFSPIGLGGEASNMVDGLCGDMAEATSQLVHLLLILQPETDRRSLGGMMVVLKLGLTGGAIP